ncbi:MAG: toxin, partial [Chloroflexi bacterium]|nr:toxin [Chloroflexota bacterium]
MLHSSIERGGESVPAHKLPSSQSTPSERSSFSAPAISLPKGGGAIRGIGEKFAANPVTGTGSLSVPIAASPGRSGFGPQLSLSYDSGAGNGPFGFGWSLGLPQITRKTDKGLPQYLDGGKNQPDSDGYILSGAEDLVPEYKKDADGNWVIENGKFVFFDEPRTIGNVTYLVRRYRPRIEGLFARIERWTNQETGEIHWRSITRDNITTLYGKDNNSRIIDPADPDPEHPTRIFSWLICQSYDDRGNAIVYEYAEENSKAVVLSQAHEKNRTASTRSANRYLKRIKYGNRLPNRNADWLATDPALLPDNTWMFEVVFDYGEGHYNELPLDPNVAETEQHRYVQATLSGDPAWPVREDPFSTYRPGFEVRTYRLCRRVLMFHHFSDELDVADTLVRSTEFAYAEGPIASFITSVTQAGFVRQENGNYLKKSLPPLQFEYSQAHIQQEIQDVDAETLENLPYGLDGARYQWVDLDGEGLPGILTEQTEGWFYKRNLSPIPVKVNGKETVVASFAPLERVAAIPSLANLENGQQQFLDLAGDGQVDLVQFNRPLSGYYERSHDYSWVNFIPFASTPNLAWEDPNLKFVDLTGDGHADILVTEDNVLTWYQSLAEEGFAAEQRTAQAWDEEKGPRLVFADGEQSIYLADLSGDGLSDLARIRNGEVCYWPNLGYGRFGAKVTMDNAPWFDAPDLFDQRRMRLADIDGSGVTDLIYLGRDGVHIYLNQSGNRWADASSLAHFPHIDNVAAVQAIDLLGNGTACLVWSSPLPGDSRRPMRYIDLMGGLKPHLLIAVKNNLGAETYVRYAPSTKFYLQDKLAGRPWITRLPFPVHVVERVETYDRISRNRFVTRYAYHHGYFDGEEREFRGFGMVEQWDTEEIGQIAPDAASSEDTNLNETSFVPPVLTRTWFHTGAYLDRGHISNYFAGIGPGDGEYYREPALMGDPHDSAAQALLLDDTVLPDGLTAKEEREACRALKGSMLRQEVYALDSSDQEQHPYIVTEQNFSVRQLQPQAENRHAVFLTHAREALSYHYERNPADPRIQHALTLEVDDFGNVLKSAAIGYGRRFDAPDVTLQPQDRERQRLIHITCTENSFTQPIVDQADAYRTPLPAETRTYELRKPEQEKSGNGLTKLYRLADALGYVQQAGDGQHDVDYEDIQFAGAKQAAADDPEEGEKYFRRLIEHVRTLYREDDLTALLPLGELGPLALPGESYQLAFTPGLLAQVFQRDGQPLLPNP